MKNHYKAKTTDKSIEEVTLIAMSKNRKFRRAFSKLNHIGKIPTINKLAQ